MARSMRTFGTGGRTDGRSWLHRTRRLASIRAGPKIQRGNYENFCDRQSELLLEDPRCGSKNNSYKGALVFYISLRNTAHVLQGTS